MEAILQYAGSDAPCRSKQLLAYFGEGTTGDCGICDVCLARKGRENPQETFQRIAGKIGKTLLKGPVQVQQLDLLFSESKEQVLEVLRAMAESGEIRIQDDTLHWNGHTT
jgi:ATP-dependent DNA helicase RecQ